MQQNSERAGIKDHHLRNRWLVIFASLWMTVVTILYFWDQYYLFRPVLARLLAVLR